MIYAINGLFGIAVVTLLAKIAYHGAIEEYIGYVRRDLW